MLVINALCDRESGHIPFPVVHDKMDVRRKDRLCMVVYRDSRVRPPEECLGQRRPVVELAFDLNVRLVRIEGKRSDPLRPVHLIHVIDQKRLAAVLIFLDQMVHRHKRSRPVVLRPVKFDAARDPWAQQPNKRRLDHMVIVHKIISVRLVIGSLDPASELREDHHLDIVVFKKHRLVNLIRFLAADLFRRRIRIHLSAAALIYSLFQKHRILIRFPHFIGWDHYLFFPYSRFAHLFHPFSSHLFLLIRYLYILYPDKSAESLAFLAIEFKKIALFILIRAKACTEAAGRTSFCAEEDREEILFPDLSPVFFKLYRILFCRQKVFLLVLSLSSSLRSHTQDSCESHHGDEPYHIRLVPGLYRTAYILRSACILHGISVLIICAS